MISSAVLVFDQYKAYASRRYADFEIRLTFPFCEPVDQALAHDGSTNFCGPNKDDETPLE